MTLIVGIDKNINGKDIKIIAGDRMASNGFTKTYKGEDDKKIFIRDKYAFGCTSSMRMRQILKYEPLPTYDTGEKHDWSEEKLLYTSFPDWVRKSLKDKGFAKVVNNEETGGNFLFYNGKNMYEIQSDFSLLGSEDGLYAVGSGEYHALGIMRAYIKMVEDKKIKFDLKYLLDMIYKITSYNVVSVSDNYDCIEL